MTSAATAAVAWSSTCKDNAHKIGGLTADVVSQDAFTVSWTALGCPGDYLVRHWQTDDKANTFTASTVPRSQTSYTASGLAAETGYTIRVLCQDPDGGRPWKATPPLAVTTLSPPPVEPDPPAPVVPTVKVIAGPEQVEGGYGTFIIQLEPVQTAPVAVQVSVTQSGDYAKSGEIGTKTVTVPALGHESLLVGTDDDVDEADGSITVTVLPGTDYAVASAPANAGTIAFANNDDPPAVVNNPATGQPTISGTAQVGDMLTADTSAIVDADGLGTFAYQWLADGSAIAGATGSSHTLTASEEGNAISVRVSFTDGRGHAESVTSAATGAVSPAPQADAELAASVADATTQEGGELRFLFTANRSDHKGFSLVYVSSDGTATSRPWDRDYYGESGILWFRAGETRKTAVVNTLQDSEVEGTETMTMKIFRIYGAEIADGTATGAITE